VTFLSLFDVLTPLGVMGWSETSKARQWESRYGIPL
jgi:hypothetical protein